MLGVMWGRAVTVFAIVMLGCGGTVVDGDAIAYDDAGNPLVDAGADARPDAKGPDARPDARPDTGTPEPDAWIDPGCPELPEPKPDYACDPLKPPPGDCKSGEACYPMVEYPTEPCEPERYLTRCVPAGSGKQGDPCSGAACAAGFACVASGAGNVCVKMCSLGAPGACADGLVCHPTDVPGIGACL